MPYEGRNGVYLGVQSNVSDVAFALTTATDTTLRIPVRLIGMPTDRDRDIYFSVMPDGEISDTPIEGEDWIAPKTVILPAGEVETSIDIKLIRSERVKRHDLSLSLILHPGPELETPVPWSYGSAYSGDSINLLRHTIRFSDRWVKLPGFNEYFLGPWSEKKNRLICSLAGLTLADFKEKMPPTKAKALGILLDQYLKRMKAEGHTVYEDATEPPNRQVEMVSGKGIYY